MTVEIPKTLYTGTIKETTLGAGDKAVKAGGETAYPFYLFEGSMPNTPRIAMEVWDTPPADWPAACREPFAGVTGDPAAWAKLCVDKYQAEMVALELVSIDPNGQDRGADEAAAVVKQVAEAVSVPLIVWALGSPEKNAEVLRGAAEVCQGKSLIIGPAEEANYKKIGAAAIGYGHTVIASSPIDINLAKQLNILMGNVGVPDKALIADPTVSCIGYGIEYAYSVIERIRMAGLTQQDERLQFPLIGNLSREVWKTREARLPDDPRLGEAARRGILLEAMSAAVLLLAGANVLVMRHPEAIRLVRQTIAGLTAAE